MSHSFKNLPDNSHESFHSFQFRVILNFAGKRLEQPLRKKNSWSAGFVNWPCMQVTRRQKYSRRLPF